MPPPLEEGEVSSILQNFSDAAAEPLLAYA